MICNNFNCVFCCFLIPRFCNGGNMWLWSADCCQAIDQFEPEMAVCASDKYGACLWYLTIRDTNRHHDHFKTNLRCVLLLSKVRGFGMSQFETQTNFSEIKPIHHIRWVWSIFGWTSVFNRPTHIKIRNVNIEWVV